MPTFEYTALKNDGSEIRDRIDAIDIVAARQALRERALLPLDIELETQRSLALRGAASAVLHPSILLPISGRDKQFMFRQLALMVKSGHRLRNALVTLRDFSPKLRMVSMLNRLIAEVDQGSSFASALEQEKKVFPKYVPALIEAGERSGTLDHILEEIASSMERARVLRNTMLRALIMPSLTLFVAFGVLAFVVLWLVPILSGFLARNGSDVHWTMQILVTLSEYFKDYGKQAAIVLAITAFFLLAIYTFERGKLILDHVLIRMPIFGRSIVLYEMSRFGSVGMLLVRSGLRQVEALEILANVTQNMAYRTLYLSAAESLRQGESMAEALHSAIFDRLARHLISVGESSGAIDEVLDRMGIYFEDEVETRIQVLFGTMVPAITILVGMVVAVVYISVLLTVLGAYTSVR